jgi:aryl-alcohol dehydrogenase-like predicted oxidoreductase
MCPRYDGKPTDPSDGQAGRRQNGRVADTAALPGGPGLGTAPMGGPGWQLDWGPSDPEESVAAVRAAVAAGVGWIDTAPFYGWGRAEEIVGAALAGMTGRPVVLTKCGDVRGRDGRAYDDHRSPVIRGDVQASLRRLRCPVIDVLQLHDPDPGTPIEESWQTICELIQEGSVRAAGLSNHPVELMDRARAVAPVSVVQHQYSLLHRAPETDGVLDWCAEHGVPFLAWSPLASGFLADGFDLAALTAGDLRRRLQWADAAVVDLAALRRGLSLIASAAGLSMSALAAGWALARGAQPIIGARTAAEARLIAALRPLPPDLAAAAQAAADAALVPDRSRPAHP